MLSVPHKPPCSVTGPAMQAGRQHDSREHPAGSLLHALMQGWLPGSAQNAFKMYEQHSTDSVLTGLCRPGLSVHEPHNAFGTHGRTARMFAWAIMRVPLQCAHQVAPMLQSSITQCTPCCPSLPNKPEREQHCTDLAWTGMAWVRP